MWGATLNQLRVLSDSGQIFHLVVDTGAEYSVERIRAAALSRGLNRAM